MFFILKGIGYGFLIIAVLYFLLQVIVNAPWLLFIIGGFVFLKWIL